MRDTGVDYNDGNWHMWDNGACPIHPNSVIEYLWDGSSGVHHEKKVTAEVARSAFRGTGENSKYFMIAFRVITPYVEPREYWVFMNGHGDLCVSSTWRNDATHVREVTE